MSDNIFFDTNIILYAYSLINDHKSIVAKRLVNETKSVISNPGVTRNL
jgi:predicted nucleic acid-binding protein